MARLPRPLEPRNICRMSILSRILQNPLGSASTDNRAGKDKSLDVATTVTATTVQTERKLRSPFEEDPSKVSRTPRGLSFGERKWTR